MLKIGVSAPDFTVPTDDGATFTLGAWTGKKNIVLYFYPKDFTIGCTKEACDFRDNFAALERENAHVVGISADDPDSHRRFKEKYTLPFSLGADTDQAVMRLYDVERKFLFPGAQRVTYVVGKSGTIEGAFRHELAIGRHQDNVLLTLQRLNAPMARRGESRSSGPGIATADGRGRALRR